MRYDPTTQAIIDAHNAELVAIDLRPATANEATYGITHKSTTVHKVTGKRDGSYPHRVVVWDNTGRPNTEPDRWNEYSGKPGPGQFLDPRRKGTDEPTSILLTAEAVVIDAYGTGTGTPGSGQVYGAPLAVGQTVTLRYPDGSTATYTI